MFSSKIISMVRKILESNGINCDGEFMLVKACDEEYTLKLILDKVYVVKYYDNENNGLNKLSLIEKNSAGLLKYNIYDNKVLMYEDFLNLDKYRKATLDDLKNEFVVNLLADWYKRLHSIGLSDVLEEDKWLRREIINLIMAKLNLRGNEALLYIYSNFENIKLKYDRVNKCVVYGGFCLENLIVSENFQEVFMTNFDKIRIGNRYDDLKEIFEFLSDEDKSAFLNKYGKISEDEIVLNTVISCVRNLYLATKEREFPGWAKDDLMRTVNGNLLENAKSLVEWY